MSRGMNAPDVETEVNLQDGEEKVTYNEDQGIQNAGTFVFVKEDHTLGNLLRGQLLADLKNIFAGYIIPHPLKHEMHVKIQTEGQDYTPVRSMENAIQLLQQEAIQLEKAVRNAIDKMEEEEEDMDMDDF